MKEKKEKKEKIRTKRKLTFGEIAGKILAAVMAIMMLVAACYTCLYLIINS